MPCVFIIVPFYNVAPYLRECLDSLIHQTYKNLRIILINDGSTDESERIAKEYLSDLRVRFISQTHKGVGCSKNVGLKEAYLQGKNEDYVVFVDSDDYLECDYIEKMVLSFQRHSQAVISFGRCESFNQKGVIAISKDHDEALSLSGLQYLSSVPNHYFCFSWGGGILMHYLRDNRLFFIEGIINEDLIFGFQCVLDAPKICFFNGIYHYRNREGSISHPKTFERNGNALIFKSLVTNFRFLLPLSKQTRYTSIKPLITNCMKGAAQGSIWRWIKDPSLSSKDALRELVPYADYRSKLAYAFPALGRLAWKILHFLKLK